MTLVVAAVRAAVPRSPIGFSGRFHGLTSELWFILSVGRGPQMENGTFCPDFCRF